MHIRNRVRFSFVVGATIVAALLPTAMRANIIFGDFTTQGQMKITKGSIDPVALFVIGSSNTSDGFTPLAGTTGTIKPITNPPYAVDTVFPTTNFMSFASAPNISFILLKLPGGGQGTCSAVPAANQICTPTNSPYVLENSRAVDARGVPLHSTASFEVSGIETDSITGDQAPFTGIFSDTFNVPYQSLANTVNGGGSINATYSGSFSVQATPEPGLVVPLTIGIGLLFSSPLRRRITSNETN